MKKIKKILLSFIGTNDAGKLMGQEDGAILTILKQMKYDEIILLYNSSSEIDFKGIGLYLIKEIKKRKLSNKVLLFELNINDVVDHNEIYEKLKTFCDTLPKNEFIEYTASISSGTPAMQVCWILLSESGDFSKEFPLKLIYIRNPKYGGDIKEVKLNTTLPKIIRLENELNNIKKSLLPELILQIKKGRVYIGQYEVPFSPIEFSYYRFFVEKKLQGISEVKMSGLFVPLEIINEIYIYHEESFPDLELHRLVLKKIIYNKQPLSTTTFRANISRLNKKIKILLNDDKISRYYQIVSHGKKGAMFYGILLDLEKIKIEN
ncbi:MAG: RNA repair transcriptional activator RtcR family protein [Ignavibacteria bacterium]|nr:RNA repair transcriptional activator RtcR family protein [Ignavibacteria bacterium]